MDLSRIDRVARTDQQGDVNEMLRDGWVLLDVTGGLDSEGYPITWYTLGVPGRDPLE